LAKLFAALEDVPFHGIDAASQCFGNLLLRQLLDGEQNDRGPLPLGQAIQGVTKDTAHFSVFDPATGIGSGGQGLGVEGVKCFPSPPEVEGEVGNDPHEPAAECLGLAQSGQIGEGFQEGILSNLHRVVDIAEEPICHGNGGPLISDSQLVECRAIAVAGLADKMAVAQALLFERDCGNQV
jgi:hypothetical protein